jgi:hypothetical protein
MPRRAILVLALEATEFESKKRGVMAPEIG